MAACVANANLAVSDEESESSEGEDSPGPSDPDEPPRHDAAPRGSGDPPAHDGAGGRRHGVPGHGEARGSQDHAPGPHLVAPIARPLVDDDDDVPDMPFDEFVASFRPRGPEALAGGAEPLEPPPVPPPPVAPREERRPRARRQIEWGPFSLASIWSTVKDEQIGWGATCGCHVNGTDTPDDPACKKQITYGREQLSDHECILKLKRWLHLGAHLSPEELGDMPRKKHVKIDARRLEEGDVATLDAWAASL